MWEAGICGPQEIVFRNFKRLESKGGYDKRIYMCIYISTKSCSSWCSQFEASWKKQVSPNRVLC